MPPDARRLEPPWSHALGRQHPDALDRETAPVTGALDRNKLARVLGMLGSAHDGELVAAGRQAERIRREAGLTWPQIFEPQSAQPLQLPSVRRPDPIGEALDLCIDNAALLSPWERTFVASISRRRFRQLSPKQQAVLDSLVLAILAQRGTR